MTRDETIAIMGILKTAFPAFYRATDKQSAFQAIALWSELFADDPAEIVSAAVKVLIATKTEYPPTIGEVKEKIRALTKGDGLTRIEAWNMVARACKNGLYGAEEEFSKLPPLVQKVVGSPNQLREWAMMDATDFSVTGSHFQRSFDIIQEREKEMQMIPADVRNLLSAVADRPSLPGGAP